MSQTQSRPTYLSRMCQVISLRTKPSGFHIEQDKPAVIRQRGASNVIWISFPVPQWGDRSESMWTCPQLLRRTTRSFVIDIFSCLCVPSTWLDMLDEYRKIKDCPSIQRVPIWEKIKTSWLLKTCFGLHFHNLWKPLLSLIDFTEAQNQLGTIEWRGVSIWRGWGQINRVF